MKGLTGTRRFCAGLRRLALIGLAAAAIAGLGSSALADTAVTSTVAADYTSGAHAAISVDPSAGPRSASLDLAPTAISDIILRSYGEFFFRIERYMSDSITKFGISNPSHVIFQFSTLDSSDDVSNNVQDMVFLNVNKAYLPMYGNDKAWIVNPSAASAADWKIGELDLSTYTDSDGTAEATAGVIVGGKLFVVMQRLNRDQSWQPTNTAYVAVFDTATDTEIDTGMGAAEGKKGVPISGKNPIAIMYQPELKKLFIACAGSYPSGSDTGYEYTGGIVTLDPETYETALLIDDGDADNHPYGAIGNLALLSATQGYFVGYASWGDTSVYAFNPTTGEVTGTVPALDNKNITVSTAGGLSVDKNGKLWVANKTDSQMVIINPSDNSLNEAVSTNLSPGTNTFCADAGALNSWVAGWYTYVLDRQGSDEEVGSMTAALQSGQFTGQSMAHMLLHGPTFTSRNVTHEEYANILCRVFFGRNATAEEIAHYANLLNNNYSRDDVLAIFINSSQFWRMCRVLGIQAF